MRILILEDDPERITQFMQKLVGHDVEVEMSTEGAIDLLENTLVPFDAMLLDHDLGGEVFVDSSREDTGMEFVRRLVETDHPKVPVGVHSANPGGRANMLGLLKQHGWPAEPMQFAWTFSDLAGALEDW